MSSLSDTFDKLRTSLLKSPFLKGVDTAEVKNYLRNTPEEAYSSCVLRMPHKKPYLQPRGGFPTFEKQRKLMLAFSEGGADYLPITIDSNTRLNDYSTAEKLLKISEEADKDFLNGYPLVAHGYHLTRKLREDLKKPISLRHGTPDPKILVELAIASGITEIEGGGICYSLPYSKSYPLDQALLNWMYVDALCAFYSETDRYIQRESFGPLTATMVPPFMVIVIQIVELMMAAEQGVKSFSVSFGQMGSFEQDVATARTLMNESNRVLSSLGYSDVHLSLVYHQWMGAFPYDRVNSSMLIALSAIIARIIAADKIVVKTKDEAFGIPTIENNVEAVKSVSYLFDKINLYSMLSSEIIDAECENMTLQVRYLLDAVLNDAKGEIWQNVYHAFYKGILDIPFSPHDINKNRLITIRDDLNRIRVYDNGLVPMPKAQINYEKHSIHSALKDFSMSQKILSDINMML